MIEWERHGSSGRGSCMHDRVVNRVAVVEDPDIGIVRSRRVAEVVLVFGLAVLTTLNVLVVVPV